MLASMFLFLSILIFIYQLVRDGCSFDLFNPKTLFQIYYIIQLPLVLFVGVNFDVPGFSALSKSTSEETVILLGSIFLFGHLAFIFGYYFTGRGQLPIPRIFLLKWNYSLVKLFCIVSFVFGYFCFYFLLQANGGYSSFIENREVWRSGGMIGQGWLIFPATTLLAISAIAYVISSSGRSKNSMNWMRLTILIVLVILPASQMGFRGLMLLPILQLLFIYNVRVRRMNFGRLAPFLLVIVTLFTLYGIYRESIYLMADGFDFDVISAFLSERPELIFAIFLRSKGADIVALVIEQHKGLVDYVLFFPSIIESLTIPIPATLWSEKPIPLSVQFSERFFGISGGVSPTIVGEAYWHAGVIGVLVFMVIMGVTFRLYYNTISKPKLHDGMIFLLTAIFPQLVMMAEAVQGYLNGIVLISIFAIFFVTLFSVLPRFILGRTV